MAEALQDRHGQAAPQYIPIPKESVEESPPSTEDDRRVRPDEINDDMQGGLTESKLHSDQMDGNNYEMQ